jgi:hypothetical protein
MLIAEFTKTLEFSTFSKNGNAHATRVGSNQQDADDFDPCMLKNGELFSRFLETEPKNALLPITLTEHYLLDHDLFFTKYPKGKVLYIQIDPISDRLLVEANFYFKVQVDSYHEIPFWHDLWDIESPIYFNNAKDPFDPNITPAMIKRLLDDRVIKNSTSYPFSINDSIIIPNVSTYAFNDILMDKQKTLCMISELTKRPIPQTASKIYDDYLTAQQPINDFLCQCTKTKYN